jgi:hypothetical protein
MCRGDDGGECHGARECIAWGCRNNRVRSSPASMEKKIPTQCWRGEGGAKQGAHRKGGVGLLA